MRLKRWSTFGPSLLLVLAAWPAAAQTASGTVVVRVRSSPGAAAGDPRHRNVFFNAENLTDVRQTRYDPLVLPAQALDGRWTTDVWAPLDGRVFNAGVRLEF